MKLDSEEQRQTLLAILGEHPFVVVDENAEPVQPRLKHARSGLAPDIEALFVAIEGAAIEETDE